SCEDVPSRNRRNRRKSSSFLSPNSPISTIISAPPRIAKRYTLFQRINHLAGLARVRQILEVIQKNNGFAKCRKSLRRAGHRQRIRGSRQIQHFSRLSRTPSSFTRLP